jgi:hypothetical protein
VTEYVILRLEQGHWIQLGFVKAASALGAIRHVAEKEKLAGTFVAAPARSWRPQVVTLEQTTSARLKSQKQEPEA